MRRIVFPPVEEATEDGLVAVGGDLQVDTLLEAYGRGIFPWPISLDFPLAWFSPDPRGVLDFEDLHVSKSFQKFLRTTNLRVSFNEAFAKVIRACGRMKRKDQPGTWITPEVITGYEALFEKEKSYSVEVWDGERLVGGLYGVIMGTFCSGESMFTNEDNASKLGLYTLCRRLEERGIKYLDTQMVTSVVEQFGGKYIPRTEFIQRISTVDWSRPRSEIF